MRVSSCRCVDVWLVRWSGISLLTNTTNVTTCTDGYRPAMLRCNYVIIFHISVTFCIIHYNIH
jgi:hypothetical protein